MDTVVIAAIVAALAAVISTIIGIIDRRRAIRLEHQISREVQRQAEEEQERKRINLKYLQPLRLYVVENHYRIGEILSRIKEHGGSLEYLHYVDEAKAVSEKDDQWFNGAGCYLISTCYFTACLFYHIKTVKDDFAYLRLGEGNDTELSDLMFSVIKAFLQDLGIYYATQPSIGNDMYLPNEERLLSYREFSQMLQIPKSRVWFDRLIDFYITAGKGNKLERLRNAVNALENLATFLDKAVGGGKSIEKRQIAEGIIKEPKLQLQSNNSFNMTRQ
jgi:hypothetical protein